MTVNYMEALESGIVCLPCKANKKPITAWKKYESTHPTPEEVKRWEALKPAAWAALCGEISGIVILDFDGQTGLQTMRNLNIEPHVESPTGGAHGWFKHPGVKVKTTNGKSNIELGKLYPGMDIRGDGGYACFFGRSADGEYKWVGPDEPYPWEALPMDLRQYLTASNKDVSENKPIKITFSSIEQILLDNALNEAPQSRDKAMFNMACQCRDNGFDEDKTMSLCRDFVDRAGPIDAHGRHDPLTEKDIAEKVKSAFRYCPRDPWGYANGQAVTIPKSKTGHEFPLTDLGNAERLIAQYGDNLRFDVNLGRWLMWNGRYWEPDQLGNVERFARECVRSMYNDLDGLDSKAKDALYKHIKGSESRQRLDAMIYLAKNCSGIPVMSDNLDTNKWLLNCNNGVVDLTNGALSEHRRDDLITHSIDMDYHPAATCPTWKRFLNDIFSEDKELIDFVQRACGYSLTGDTSEQCFFILHGSGSNGKSTFINVLSDILHDFHRKIDTKTLLSSDREGIPNDIARLRGARLVTAIEATPGKRLAEALLKELVGQDIMSARFLRQEYFDFRPQLKLWLAVNHLPHIDGQDHGIWRRVRIIPFNVQFGDETGTNAAARNKDKGLPEKLKLEYPGILTWMIKGCLLWQTSGLGNANAVRMSTEKYKDDMDVLAGFISECCLVDPERSCRAADLYDTYKRWADRHGERFPMNQRLFSQRLEERGTFTRKRRDSGVIWYGIDTCYIGPE